MNLLNALLGLGCGRPSAPFGKGCGRGLPTSIAVTLPQAHANIYTSLRNLRLKGDENPRRPRRQGLLLPLGKTRRGMVGARAGAFLTHLGQNP